MRRALTCLSLLLLAQGITAQAPYHSLTKEFEQVADSTTNLPMEERVKVLRSTFDKLYPGLYSDNDEAELNARIARALVEFPSIRTAYDGVQRDFPGAFSNAVQRFRLVFVDFSPPLPIYFIHSLGTRDGGTDRVAGREVMIFGADEIAQFHWDESLQPFIIHELFHLEHGRYFADCDQLWCSLWQEGLATYVASRLTPHASEHQLILDVPHSIPQPTDAHWQEAVCWTAGNFDSTDKTNIDAAFNGGPLPSSFSNDPELSGLPSRFGYYVGFKVATQVAKRTPLTQMSKLNHEHAREAVAKALAELISTSHLKCSPPPPGQRITASDPRHP